MWRVIFFDTFRDGYGEKVANFKIGFQDYEAGKFDLLSPQEAIEETALFIKELNVHALLLSDHISNYANVQGQMPRDKKSILNTLEELKSLPRDAFRPNIIAQL